MIRWLVLALATLLAACAIPNPPLARGDAAREQVIATERAFARTMAERDLKAFGSFLADEAVFFSGPKPLHGSAAVIEFWSRFYAKPEAPFSWEPTVVEVLEGGTLALSSGPVHNPEGKLIGCFQSVWRQEAPGRWKIVFDRGSSPDNCDKK
jgi:ketosteroid isomerase-like protein